MHAGAPVNKHEHIREKKKGPRRQASDTRERQQNPKIRSGRASAKNENEAELILFARILLLAPDCLKRCASNRAAGKDSFGPRRFIFTSVRLRPPPPTPTSRLFFFCESVRVRT